MKILKKVKLLLAYIFFELRYRQKKRTLEFPHVLSDEETIEYIVSHNASMSRFGDGEMRWIMGMNKNTFQDNSALLSQRLQEVLSSDDGNVLICIPNVFEAVGFLQLSSRVFWRSHLDKTREYWMNSLIPYKIYGDSLLTRPYFIYKDKSGAGKRFKHLVSIWDKKDLLIVEGEKTRLGVGNDLFDNAKSVARLLCPSENAFAVYDSILSTTIQNYQGRLVLIALGPTATILAYDLSKRGIRALDIGHIDVEYEWFLRKVKERIAIPGKYVNESEQKYINEESVLSGQQEYLNSIVARIL
ncbi:SP_1767 family glycosyltransferase [Sphaerochaeta globosa]|uniref:Glycosyltransferase, SP_1767 family n=1 Tax=Sphaerochaeta globosa (strain ATCC BAA-1886 / DSM 22777 / Buddy) TaxID=158189 RepID=F0RXV0_SPHGB|nr:SP_1767 family glycosyltransferase [Sphaerochaeta globosa]ADY12227.1 glycosyltransferase, SP_1767 family [Sphaerochaeta globosa str. Buddy]